MTANVKIQTASGSDIYAFGDFIYNNVQNIIPGPTTIVIVATNGDKFVVKGTNFTYDGFGNLTGGTATGAALFDSAGLYASVSGVAVDALLILAAVQSKSIDDFFNLLGPIKFVGNDGADVGRGGTLGDSLIGGLSDDTLYGYGGKDTIEGGGGADTMYGGSGKDTLSYQHSLSGVVVNLTTGFSKGGASAGDTFTGFENLLGSDYKDSLVGNKGANTIDGRAGNDMIAGKGGADTIIGGGGIDLASYVGSPVGVTVNLNTGTGLGGHAQGDSLSGIENLRGSAHNDTLVGGLGANKLIGDDGDDVLKGGHGADKLLGGTGNDYLDGGKEIDVIFGGSGSDTFYLSNREGHRDKIRDYKSGVDHLEIDAAVFGGGLVAGVDLTAGQLVINTTGEAGDADDRFILNSTTGELLFDINGSVGGTNGSRMIAELHGNLAGFSIADFDIA